MSRAIDQTASAVSNLNSLVRLHRPYVPQQRTTGSGSSYAWTIKVGFQYAREGTRHCRLACNLTEGVWQQHDLGSRILTYMYSHLCLDCLCGLHGMNPFKPECFLDAVLQPNRCGCVLLAIPLTLT